MSAIDQLRQSEHIGENRCIPCTIANIVIAAGASIFAGTVSVIFGICLFGFSLVAIYLRGYLVPGTPTLTKRYFPESILRWFGKDSIVPRVNEALQIDPEQILLEVNAIEPFRNNADLCLTPEFQKEWHEHVLAIREHAPGEDSILSMFEIQPETNQITVEQQGDALVAYDDDVVIGQWSSQPAVIADIAAATELGERYFNWADLAPAEIASVLMSLRIFIEQCPKCDGPVQVEQEIVESCCQSHDVVASACQDCDARLFEMEIGDNIIANESPIQSRQSA